MPVLHSIPLPDGYLRVNDASGQSKSRSSTSNINAIKLDTNQNRLYVHPNTLVNKLGCRLDALVWLSAGQFKIPRHLWPLSSIPENFIATSSSICKILNIKYGDGITVSPVETPILEADAVKIRWMNQNWKPGSSKEKQLQSLLRYHLIDEVKYVVAELPYSSVISASGRPYRFEVSVFHKKPTSIQEQLLTSLTLTEHIYIVSLRTEFVWPSDSLSNSPNKERMSFNDVGGLQQPLAQIREMIELPLYKADIFARLNLAPPQGLLMYGPPGTGKTMIARVLATQLNCNFVSIDGAEVVTKFFGETEAKLRSIFMEAVKNSPSLIFIDEIDALCPKRDDATNEVEKRIVATLLALMDEIRQSASQSFVFVLAATNRVHSLDPALRRPGRFDQEIEIGIPTASGRTDILTRLLNRIEKHGLTVDDIETLAFKMHGYVGADINAVVREAAVRAIRRQKLLNNDDLDSLQISALDVEEAMVDIQPSTMREIVLDVPKVYWDDIGGQEIAKARLKEAVEWPLTHSDMFHKMGIRTPKGVLLYGPPGCSKTLLAKALATEAQVNFLAIKGPEIFSKYVGDSEKAIKEIFKKARAASPSILFFDEIDAVAVKRGAGDDGGGGSVADRVLSQILIEMDGIEPLQNVTVIGATNRPDALDSALLRAGRIDRMVYVGPPDFSSRYAILKIKLSKTPLASDVDLTTLAEKTEGFSGAEVAAACLQAGLNALEESMESKDVAMRHLMKAVENITPRITEEVINFYENFQLQTYARN